MQRSLGLAVVIGFFGTLLAVVAAYTDFGLVVSDPADAFYRVTKWPLLHMAVQLTTYSLLVPFLFFYFRETSELGVQLVIYYFALWIAFFFYYPGTKALAVNSDGAAAISWFLVSLSQVLAARTFSVALLAKARGAA